MQQINEEQCMSIINEYLVTYFNPEHADCVLRHDFPKPHLKLKYMQCLEIDQLPSFVFDALQIVADKLILKKPNPNLDRINLNYWQIFNDLPQPKDELISFIFTVTWFLIHSTLYKLYPIDKRTQLDQRFMYNAFHVLIHSLNGLFVSDEYVRTQVESYLTPRYLDYRLNYFQKKNLKKVQTQQSQIFPNMQMPELSAGSQQLKKDIRNRRRILKPATELSERNNEPNENTGNDGSNFPTTLKFNLHQLSPSINQLVQQSVNSPRPNYVSHKIGITCNQETRLIKALKSLHHPHSTTVTTKLEDINRSQKILDQYKVTLPPTDYYKKNPKVDHLFKDMLDMRLILQHNPIRMQTSPRIKEDGQTARDRIILYLDERQTHIKNQMSLPIKFVEDEPSTAWQTNAPTTAVLTSRRESPMHVGHGFDTPQKLRNKYGVHYQDKRREYSLKYGKVTDKITTDTKINHLQLNIQSKLNYAQQRI